MSSVAVISKEDKSVLVVGEKMKLDTNQCSAAVVPYSPNLFRRNRTIQLACLRGIYLQ